MAALAGMQGSALYVNSSPGCNNQAWLPVYKLHYAGGGGGGGQQASSKNKLEANSGLVTQGQICFDSERKMAVNNRWRENAGEGEIRGWSQERCEAEVVFYCYCHGPNIYKDTKPNPKCRRGRKCQHGWLISSQYTILPIKTTFRVWCLYRYLGSTAIAPVMYYSFFLFGKGD